HTAPSQPTLLPYTTLFRSRKTKVQSWYFDLTQILRYWAQERAYHHTAPISMVYAIREGLRIVLEEGLQARWDRHMRNHRALKARSEEHTSELQSQSNLVCR